MPAFLHARDALAGRGLGTCAEAVLDGLHTAGVRAALTRPSHGDRSVPPPLLPALAETVLFWSRALRPVLVVHDGQSVLTTDRVRRLQRVLAGGAAASPLLGLLLVDSRDYPRVQLADLLAGVARQWPATVDDGPLRPLLSQVGEDQAVHAAGDLQRVPVGHRVEVAEAYRPLQRVDRVARISQPLRRILADQRPGSVRVVTVRNMSHRTTAPLQPAAASSPSALAAMQLLHVVYGWKPCHSSSSTPWHPGTPAVRRAAAAARTIRPQWTPGRRRPGTRRRRRPRAAPEVAPARRPAGRAGRSACPAAPRRAAALRRAVMALEAGGSWTTRRSGRW